MERKTGCLICGDKLVYNSEITKHKCVYCSQKFSSNEVCVNGHYVCDSCHSSDAMELIENFCVTTQMKDPINIANLLMKNPQVKMHGPEHHFLVPAVLLASYYNQVGMYDKKGSSIKTARKRAEKVPGGFCGFHGACGAGIGVGIFVSTMTGATPVSNEPWKLSNQSTARALEAIADCGGPRCCKRDTYLAIYSAQNFVNEKLDQQIKVKQKVVCEFHTLNNECLGKECQFYKKAS